VRDADPPLQLLYGSSERRCVDGYAEKQKSTPPMDLHRVEERNLNDSCTILQGGGYCRVSVESETTRIAEMDFESTSVVL
jgi:hypothetical protein